jgi:hypothetical protein
MESIRDFRFSHPMSQYSHFLQDLFLRRRDIVLRAAHNLAATFRHE